MGFGLNAGSSLRQSGLVALAAAVIFCSSVALSQAVPPQGASNPAAGQSPATGIHTARKHKKKAAVAEPAPVEAVLPPQPPPPKWPANDQAVPASVGWNGRDLSVAATNSSLVQIMHDISAATGVEVEGMSKDQRVFGSYGPAPAREVLSQLLEGSGYNVLMIGDKGQGEPRELVLTAKAAHPTGNQSQMQPGQQPQATDDDQQQEEPEQPEQPEPGMRRPFNAPQQPGSGRTPQQMMEEMQQRQQQLQQQMQNNPQQTTPPNDQP